MTMNVPYEGGFLMEHRRNAPRRELVLDLLVSVNVDRPEGLAKRYATIP